jgi:PAS domain S-box-containing protein
MSESKYRFLLDNLPLRIFYKDRNSVYISCNVNYARDLHIKPEEISGKTDYDFYPKELAEKYRTDDRKIMESGQKKDTDEKYFKDGQKLIIHTVRVPIKNEKGESIGILGSFLDITEKANLEKETQRSRNLALIGELAAGVAHEINNPATGVINCAQILLNKSREGSTEKDLACRIIKEGDRIATIVSKLLSFARPQEKKTITDMHEILFDTLVLIEKQLKKDCITIKQDIPNDLPEIFANPQQIQQVFMNIISNARYALNQKYPEIHENKILEISGEKIMIHNHPHIKITFCDHGTGIPANVKDKIMNPFFTTKPHGKGTGLGLSISHNIIHDHNGKLTIDSVEGEYTKVIITLPTKVKTIRGTA